MDERDISGQKNHSQIYVSKQKLASVCQVRGALGSTSSCKVGFACMRYLGTSPNQLNREFPACRIKRWAVLTISHSLRPDVKADESGNIVSSPVGLALVPGDVALLRLQWNNQLEGPGRVPNHVQGETILLCQQGPVRGCQEGNIIQSILVLPGLRELQYGWPRVLQSEGGEVPVSFQVGQQDLQQLHHLQVCERGGLVRNQSPRTRSTSSSWKS